MLSASLVTFGSPGQLTGGYLFHRRLADRARVHDARLDFVSLPARRFPLPALWGRSALRRAGAADVVVIDSIAAAFLAPWVRSPVARRRPVVAMAHQPPGGIDHGAPRRWVQARADEVVYRRCELLMLAADALCPAFAGLGRRIEVVAPGRDVAPLPIGDVPELRGEARVALLSVGNWVERKGTLDLLEAVARLPAGLVTLHLVGRTDVEPRYAARVRQRLARPDLADRVVVHGPVDRTEVARLYTAADVFVLASMVEPYGTVYGEAMAAGLPVVGWRAGNLPNLADDGREGVVVEPGDLAGLAAGLERLAGDDELRSRMAAAALVRAQGFPTWDDTATRFFALLRSVVSR